jgi:hypothetical protein
MKRTNDKYIEVLAEMQKVNENALSDDLFILDMIRIKNDYNLEDADVFLLMREMLEISRNDGYESGYDFGKDY